MDEQLPRALAADLDSGEYTVAGLDRRWGAAASAALTRGFATAASRALADDDAPAATLAKLFILGLDVSIREVDAALPTVGLRGAARLGLVERIPGEERVRAVVDVRPYSASDDRGDVDWWIVSDFGETARPGPLADDHVLGIGGAGATLASLTIRRDVADVLDLGTGCGIQALHASRHADRVLATDVSQRALRFAELNAALNGRDNIEFRRSDLYDGLEPRRFDLIVSNPPFVITPRCQAVPQYSYRDGGLAGDEIVRRVVTQAADRLKPGGIFQLLGNWEHAGDDGLDRVRGWLDETDLDAWVVEREVQDSCEYAETWIQDGGTRPGSEQFDPMYAAWIEDFARRGVEKVGFGYVLLRRPGPGTSPLRRVEKLQAATGALGSHLDDCLRAHDRLGDDLMPLTLQKAADVTEERHFVPGSEDPTVIMLRQGGGFARTMQLDTATAGFIGACDGQLTVGRIIDALAALLDTPASELSASIVPTVRNLVDYGFLNVDERSNG